MLSILVNFLNTLIYFTLNCEDCKIIQKLNTSKTHFKKNV